MEQHDTLKTSPYKSRPGFKRLLLAASYSLRGIRAAWQHEAAFRQEVTLGALLALASCWLAPTLLYWVLMNAALLGVLCMEAMNSAIEALADAISTDTHPLLGRAKDLGSAAVLFCILIAACIWIAAVITRLELL